MSMQSIRASDIILGHKTHKARAHALADHLLLLERWTHIEILLDDVPAKVLIRPFFEAFLRRIHQFSPGRTDKVRDIVWIANYEFQEERIDSWLHDIEIP